MGGAGKEPVRPGELAGDLEEDYPAGCARSPRTSLMP